MTEPQAERDRVARIIDPAAFIPEFVANGLRRYEREDALSKADAILSGGGGEAEEDLADFIRDQVCCPRIHGCELGGSEECPAERVRAALRPIKDFDRMALKLRTNELNAMERALAAEATILTLEARNKALEEGLRPFAAWFDHAGGERFRDGPIMTTWDATNITNADFRQASRLLSEEKEDLSPDRCSDTDTGATPDGALGGIYKALPSREEIMRVIEPFAILYGADSVRMTDPLDKWLRIHHLANAAAMLDQLSRTDPALSPPQAEGGWQSAGYRYKYPDGCWRHSNGREINGSRPIASQELFYRAAEDRGDVSAASVEGADAPDERGTR